MGDYVMKQANDLRMDIVELCHKLGSNAAHLGGCLSLADLMVVLYLQILQFNRNDLSTETRDRVIMSKGHGSIAMYAGMYRAGIIKNLDDLGNLLGKNNIYYKQEVRNTDKGIEFSSGSLGQGLAYGIGIAWSLKRKENETSKVYVFIGDGECDEGSVWEAASIAGHLKLNNLVVVVDKNGLQIDGKTSEINSQETMVDRWNGFGFNTVEIDGHDVFEIKKAYEINHPDKPLAIIAHTTKGKGVSFAEGEAEWHQNVLSDELYHKAIDELENNRRA
jgi:transketolase